jgi:hypothetical protein
VTKAHRPVDVPGYDFATLLALFVRSVLETGKLCFERVWINDGRLFTIWPVDAATIHAVTDKPGVAYVQLIGGAVHAEFGPRDIVYRSVTFADLTSLLNWLAELITAEIVAEFHADLEFLFTGVNPTDLPVSESVESPTSASATNGSGRRQCKAKSKSTGERCRKLPVGGYEVCGVHGAGHPVRVERGERKPCGAPPTTGARSDPNRTRYGRLQELIDQAKSSPAELRSAEAELALMKGVLAFQYEKLLAGEWDMLKTPDLEEHPSSWLIEAGAKVVDRVAKVNSMINRDRLQALVAIVNPVINVVMTVIEQHVPDGAKVEARETVRKKLSAILIPTG